MIALQDTLVEWTVLAVALAVAAALLLRVRQQQRRLSRRSRVWLPCVALAVIVANAGIAVDAAAAGGLQAAAASEPGEGGAAAAVRLGAIAALVSLVVLLMAWLYLSRSLRVLPPAREESGGSCCADCPECSRENQVRPAQNPGRKRARGLTMTRLGGE